MKENILKIILIILIILVFCVVGIVYIYDEDNIGDTNIVSDSLLDKQLSTDIMIEEYKKDTSINIENPIVINNPYHISPLTSIIIFHTESFEEVRVKINENKEISFPASTEHVIPIYGLYPDYNNKVVVTVGNNTKEISIKTEGINLPNMEILKEYTDSQEVYLITSNDLPIIYSNEGRILWYLTENYGEDAKLLENGHIILSKDQTLSDNSTKTGFIEVDLLGKIYGTVQK